MATHNEQDATELARRAKRWPQPVWYLVVVSEALLLGAHLTEAMDAADRVLAETPIPPREEA